MPHDTEHFKVSEFRCKCPRHENEITQTLIDMAETIRTRLGVPVHVNSGYRCVEHNRNVNGVPGSTHTKGFAADLSCKLGSAKIFETCKELYNEGKLPALDYCLRYIRSNFVHIDCGGKRNNRFAVVNK